VLLPALSVDTMATGPEDLAPPARGRGETVLLVEDEESLRTALASILRRFDYRVLDARNGDEARALWQAQHGAIDLLITDMVMPGKTTGLQLIESLRRDKHELRAIICSGYLNIQSIPDSSGIAILPKPFEATVLLRTVRRCLDGTATSKASRE